MYLALIVTQKPICPVCEESIEEEIAMYEAWVDSGRGHHGGNLRRRDVDLTLDHLMPRSRGGADDITNLRLVHRKCNLEKANRTLEEYKQGVPPIYKPKKAQQSYPHHKEKTALRIDTWKKPSYVQAKTKKKKAQVIKLIHEEPPYIKQLRKLGLI